VLSARAQETLFTAGGNKIYSNIFDDNSLHSFTAAGVTASLAISGSAAGNLNQVTAGRSIQSTTTTTGAGSVGYSILTNGTDLNGDDYEWSILYKTTITQANWSKIIDLQSAAPTGTNAGWRYWLNSQDAVPSATTQGFYVTQVNNQIILRARNSNYNTDIITYTLPTPSTATPVYNIKVQRRVISGLIYWYLAVGESTAANPETSTFAGFNGASVTQYNIYGYTVLESYSKSGATATFSWDDIKLYTSFFNVTGLNSAANNVAQNSYLLAGNSYALFGFDINSRGLHYEQTNRVFTTSTGSSNLATQFSAFNIVKSTDNAYSSDDALVSAASDFTQPSVRTDNFLQAFGASDLNSHAYYFLVGTVRSTFNAPTDLNAVINFKLVSGSSGFTDGAFVNYGATPQYSPSYSLNTYSITNSIGYTFAYQLDWVGATLGSGSGGYWDVSTNWSPAIVPGANDAVRIGVGTSFKYQPVVRTTASVGSVALGAIKSTLTGTPDKVITVNSSQTLTVSGDITQNHSTSNIKSKTSLYGAGTLTCQNLYIGDASVPANSGTVATDSTVVSSLINQFNILGNITLTSNVSANGSVAYFPAFNLDANTTAITGQIITVDNSNSTSTTFNSTFTSAPIRGRFNINNTNNNNKLTLFNTNPLATLATGQGCDFNFAGSVNAIVEYASTGSGQAVYTSADGIGSAGGTYENLTFTGGSKIVHGGSMSVTVNWNTTSTGAVDLNTNDPAITVGGNWTNSTDVTQDAGNIAISGSYSSSAGTLTLGSGNMAVTANATITAGGITGSASSASLTVGGALSNSGTINSNAQNITITGNTTNNSIITGGAGTLLFTGTYNNTTGSSITTGAGTATFTGTYTNTTGSFTAGAGSVIYKNNYTNTGTFTAGSGTIYFNNGAQALVDNSTGATIFNNVNFNGSSLTTTIKSMSGTGGFGVSPTGILTMANATTKLDAGGALTLMSNAASTASVDIIPSGAVITGNVDVQRYITGGAGYRGYRLLSSPVNVSLSTSGAGNISLAYINTSNPFGGVTYNGALTGGKGTGFSVTNNNPTLYLYDETKTVNNTTFVGGKNVGIYSIAASTVTTISGTTQTSGVSIPVGNSLLFFFIGDNSNLTNLSAATRTPENTTITATGYLNQNNVPVKFWKAGTTTIPYTLLTGSALPGYNQVGNPYASTINLDVVYSDNYNLVTNAISPIFWEMNEPGQTYISYNASSHTTSNTKASKYIVSGQGFIVDATLPAVAQTITFKEDQKVAYPTGFTKSTLPALLMSTKDDIAFVKSTATETPLTGLHLQMTRDSAVNTQCGIYFNKSWDDAFHNTEDGLDLDGASPKVYMSSYSSDGVRTGINQLADYKEKGKRIKLFVNATASSLYHIDLADINNFDTVNYKIYLVDKLKKDSLDIGKYKTYAFNLVTTDTNTFGANRFELSINQVPASKYQLATFTAQKAPDGVLLTWRTRNEGNNYFFTLEKQQVNGTDYSPLYNILSNGGTIYKYTDKTPNTGNNVYRLKQVDLFGNITYSNPVNIYYDKSGTEGMFSVYPNPTAETLNLNITYGLTTTAATSYKLNIYDATGSLVMQKTSDANKWSENVSQFKPGIYIVELKGNSGISLGKTKFVKQ
jgi:hypothetical protein